jgi:hypothetical protein
MEYASLVPRMSVIQIQPVFAKAVAACLSGGSGRLRFFQTDRQWGARVSGGDGGTAGKGKAGRGACMKATALCAGSWVFFLPPRRLCVTFSPSTL